MNLFQIIGELLGSYSPRIIMLYKDWHWKLGIIFATWPIVLMIVDVYSYIQYPIGFTISLPFSLVLYGISSLIPSIFIRLSLSLLGICFVHYFIGSYISYILKNKSNRIRNYVIIGSFALLFGPSIALIIGNP
jgi:FtsH-binding integral membrane protein